MRQADNLRRIAVLALSGLSLLALLPLTERPAYGYTDPGSGALIWQTLVAGFVGLSFYFRRILAWFKRRKKVSGADEV